MTAKQTDALSVENHRDTVKYRHSRAIGDHSLTTLLPAAATRGEEAPKPRFDVDKFECEAEKLNPSASPMRVLLQNAKTHKFLSGSTGWTSDPKRARDFRSGWWATLCAFTMNPRNLVIHYEFANNRYNLRIPVLGHAAPAECAIEPA